MKVTDIKAQVKRAGRYSIYVDGKFAFGISELGLIDSGIRIGAEFDAERLSALKSDAETDKIYNLALSLVLRRPRSSWELRDYLRRKDVEPDTQTVILQKLESRGYVDDEDFARRWVENRRLLKPISRRKLQLELKQKRVPDSIASKVLSEDEIDDSQAIVAAIEKKRRQSRYQDEAKLMQYLSRQGYGYDDIKRALAGDTG